MDNEIRQEFREEEVAIIRYWDKSKNEWITSVFPKIGGRLRLAHEQNETITIETEIYKYDENVAVVIGTCRTAKGVFKGIGMSSVARDQKIAPAILELAETRSIARALRFAGFGVEYCSAEEISHLEAMDSNDKGNTRPKSKKQIEPPAKALPAPANNTSQTQADPSPSFPNQAGTLEIGFTPVNTAENVFRPQFKTTPNQSPPENNGNARKQMSLKQFNYIQSYGRKLGYDLNALSQKSIEIFNRELAYLTVSEASTFIDHMHAGFLKNTTAV